MTRTCTIARAAGAGGGGRGRLRRAAPAALPRAASLPLQPLLRLLLLTSLLLPAAGITGCGGDARQGLFSERPELAGPYALDRYLYYLDRKSGELLVVDPLADDGPIVRSIPAEAAAPAPVVVPAGEAGAGHRWLALLEPARHELLLVREAGAAAADEPLLQVERHRLRQAYDRLSVSPDGRFLLASLTPSAKSGRDLVTVVGKVAVLALPQADGQGEDGTVVEQILDLEQAPSQVLISGRLLLKDSELPLPAATCDGSSGPAATLSVEEERHLALLVTAGRMAILDLERPELRARTLTFGNATAPSKLVFAPDPDGHPRILFISRGTMAVTSLTVSLSREKHACAANEQDDDMPELVIDALDLGADLLPGDLAVLSGAGGVPTVVAPGQKLRKAAVLQLRGSLMGDTVDLDVAVSKVVKLTGSDGRDVALLYSTSGERQVALLRLVGEDEQAQLSVTYPKPFGYPVSSVRLIPGQPSRVLIHLETGGNEVLEVLDVDTGRAHALSLAAEPRDSVFSSSGGLLYLVAGSEWKNEGFLVELGLGSAHELGQTTVRLDYPPRAVMLLEGVAGGLVVVDHGDPAGRLTLVPVEDLQRGSAWLLDGIFLDHILEQGR